MAVVDVALGGRQWTGLLGFGEGLDQSDRRHECAAQLGEFRAITRVRADRLG
ncbi:hypothetical protein AB0I52_22180 [Streptomyces sp. NPDC050423]|uniref:hypothetical protein n=1 Tax=Streptomyces sp. NPDC050423 TaxID=3155402 RepID=UPI003420EEF0